MGYTPFDQFIAWCRFRAALPHIRQGAHVCDIGCGLNPWLFGWARQRIGVGVGLDLQVSHTESNNVHSVRTDITHGLPVRSRLFDHATMLAVLEHLTKPEPVLREIYRILKPSGSLIMTRPRSVVDPILSVLHRIGIVSDEMESDQHQRRIPLDELKAMLREIGFERFAHRTFELGLNNLLVAYKPAR